MKRPKKLTRHQREYLRRKKIDYDNVLVIEETNVYIKLLRNGSEVEVVNK